MGIFSKIFGEDQRPAPAGPVPHAGQLGDEQAIERYRYMLKTAPPETIEQAHADAFSRLTPQQRRMLLEQLNAAVPAAERATAARTGDDPQALARLATRAEMRQPGTMERTFGGMGGGAGLGRLMAGSFLSTIAGVVVGSMIAQQFFNHDDVSGGTADAAQQADADTSQDVEQHAFNDSGGDIGDAGGFDV